MGNNLLTNYPFAVQTFIVAPAILTNTTEWSTTPAANIGSLGVAGFVHQQGLEFGQLMVVIVNGVGRGGESGIEIHERDQGAIGGHVVNRQHGANAASRPQSGIAVLLMELLHNDCAIAELGQKHLVGVCGDDGRLHDRNGQVKIVEHAFQRFKLRE